MNRCWALLSALACVSACGDAFGSFISVRDAMGGESPLGSPGGLYLVGTGSEIRGVVDGSSHHLGSGVFDFELSLNGGVDWSPLLTFCTDPLQNIGFDDWPGDQQGLPYEVLQLTNGGITPAEEVILEKLWFHAFAIAQTGTIEAGAFQAIVWELTEDDTIDLSSGNFSLIENLPKTTAIGALARTWLENIENGTWSQQEPLMELFHAGSQNLLIPERWVPAPGSTVVMGLGALLAVRRRR